MRRKRDINVFGLSFLDVMFCGFGSVILLVMIINSDTLAQRKEVQQDLRGEVKRLETEVLTGQEYLVEVRNTLDEVSQQDLDAQGRARQVSMDIERIELEMAVLDKQTQARKEHVNRLKSDLKQTDADRARLASEQERAEKQGRNVRQFIGEGDRQYVTGLKLGGDRILLLVDLSASMLDETIVNIVRLRNLPDDTRKRAPKWQRAVRTVEWLLSQLPAGSRFQLYGFSTDARALAKGTDAKWLDAGQSGDLSRAAMGLNQAVPAGGTSLYNAFESIKGFNPAPDNLILVTDGLPTQGKTAPGGGRVSGQQRMGYFRQALTALPGGLPVNTILFPIEGDPYAAAEFWKLAAASGGSFLSPSKDWP